MDYRDRGSRGTGRIPLFLALILSALCSDGALHAQRLAGIGPTVARAEAVERIITPASMGPENLRSRRDLDLATSYHYLRADDLSYRKAPAQSGTGVPAADQRHTPEWQVEAGGKLAFEVESVKLNKSGLPPVGDKPNSNVTLDAADTHADAGSELAATNFPLLSYIGFAYKLSGKQLGAVLVQLPPWARSDRFDVRARARDSLTKDQMRLAMQALLADRFKLAIHYQPRQTPAFAIVLDKPGQLGAQLHVHPEGSPCAAEARPQNSPSDPPPIAIRRGGLPGFPAVCGGMIPYAGQRGLLRAGARNVSMGLMAALLTAIDGLDRPLLDLTGQRGTFDFIIEFAPPENGPPPPGDAPHATTPTFEQALREQLGLKLAPRIGLVDALVIDHVEEPATN
jgi:uncharacterized protein (TIGR03435 family)